MHLYLIHHSNERARKAICKTTKYLEVYREKQQKKSWQYFGVHPNFEVNVFAKKYIEIVDNFLKIRLILLFRLIPK